MKKQRFCHSLVMNAIISWLNLSMIGMNMTNQIGMQSQDIQFLKNLGGQNDRISNNNPCIKIQRNIDLQLALVAP